MKKWKKFSLFFILTAALTGLFTTTVSAVSPFILLGGEEGDLQPEILQRLYDNFVKDDRWKYLVEGLGRTLLITVVAMIIGTLIGFLLAIIRVAHDKNGSVPHNYQGYSRYDTASDNLFRYFCICGYRQNAGRNNRLRSEFRRLCFGNRPFGHNVYR